MRDTRMAWFKAIRAWHPGSEQAQTFIDRLWEEKMIYLLDLHKKGDFCCLHPKGSDATKYFTQNILQLISNPIRYNCFHFIKEDIETE